MTRQTYFRASYRDRTGKPWAWGTAKDEATARELAREQIEIYTAGIVGSLENLTLHVQEYTVDE